MLKAKQKSGKSLGGTLSAKGAIWAIRIGSSQLGVPNLKSANAPKSLTQRPLVSCQQIEPILKQAAHQKLLAHEQLP